jgi:hypothetical protein
VNIFRNPVGAALSGVARILPPQPKKVFHSLESFFCLDILLALCYNSFGSLTPTKEDKMFWLRDFFDWISFSYEVPDNRWTRFLNSLWFDLAMVVLSLPFAYLSGLGYWEVAGVFLLLVGQNISFTWVSRARQTKNLFLHKAMSVLSNGFYIFVVTSFVAYYKNTPMKFIYVAGTLVGASLGHRSMLRIEQHKALTKDTVVTKADLVNMRLDFETRTNRLHAMSILVYSRALRKVRALRDWALATFATKQELQDLKAYFEDKIGGLLLPQPVFRASEEFRERQKIHKLLSPNPHRKNKPTPRWLKFDRAGHPHLNL